MSRPYQRSVKGPAWNAMEPGERNIAFLYGDRIGLSNKPSIWARIN